jgi:predicted SnoaL-like aldol condensation-catalyzing enzyme
VPVLANTNHAQMLASPDAKLAANKRIVYDFWREVFEGRHMDLAEKYMAESYIQHNPNVATGRAAFIDFFSKLSGPKPIEAQVKAPLVAIVAEGDLVVLSFVREGPTRRTRRRSTRPPGSTCSASRAARSPSTGTARRSSDAARSARDVRTPRVATRIARDRPSRRTPRCIRRTSDPRPDRTLAPRDRRRRCRDGARADDRGRRLPGRRPAADEGARRIRTRSARTARRHRVESTHEIHEVVVDGDLAYSWTDLQVRVIARDGGAAPPARSGSTLSVLRRQADGRWRMVRDANLMADAHDDRAAEGGARRGDQVDRALLRGQHGRAHRQHPGRRAARVLPRGDRPERLQQGDRRRPGAHADARAELDIECHEDEFRYWQKFDRKR